jgi:DNA mismatch repair protein MutS
VTEHVHDRVGALTLFATHHHDLTAVAADLDRAVNLHVRTHQDDGVVFDYAVERGAAAASYGVEVAATAGIPDRVVDRARELLGEAAGADRTNGESRVDGAGASENDGPPRLPGAARERLRDVDVATMTPLEALNTLAALQRELE